jgi:hypothetical protein
MKMIFIFTLVLSGHAMAQQNLPNFQDVRMVGRVPAYPSPRGVSWFLPVAFQTQLSCSPQALSRSCILKIVNSLSVPENDGLMQIQKGAGSGVIAITPLNSNIVSRVAESFQTKLEGVQTSEMKLGTLVMNERTPYATLAIRGDAASIAKIEQAYVSTGLGSFDSEISLNVENVGEYIAIRNGDVLKQMLSSLPANLTKQQMIEAIEAFIPKLDLQAYNVSAHDAAVAAASRIRAGYFQFTRYKGYSVANDAEIPKTLVIRDEHSAPYRVLCVATIPLKANASVEIGCTDVTP